MNSVAQITTTRTALPTVVPNRPIYIIDTHGLSDEARDYLRHGLVRSWLAAGASKRDASWRANVWAAGYRAFGRGIERSRLSGAALDGWIYAHGEDCWLQCMEIEAAQNSAGAAGYPQSCLW